MEFHKVRFALRVDEPVAVHAEAFHHGKRARNGPIAHDPHEHMHRFRREGHEIVKGIVGGRGLRDFVVRLRLYGMDQVREFDRILNEENWDIVAN
jgi:hypothetical protein